MGDDKKYITIELPDGRGSGLGMSLDYRMAEDLQRGLGFMLQSMIHPLTHEWHPPQSPLSGNPGPISQIANSESDSEEAK